MAEAEVITAVGRNKKSIKAGDTVKYVNSDTISRVTEIKKTSRGMYGFCSKVQTSGIRKKLWSQLSLKLKKRKKKGNSLRRNWKKDLENREKQCRPSISGKPVAVELEDKSSSCTLRTFSLIFSILHKYQIFSCSSLSSILSHCAQYN